MPRPANNREKRSWVLAGAAIAAGGIAAYAGSFKGAFVMDDLPTIVDNPAIHRLWPAWEVFFPRSSHFTVGGRPLANLSLALNYAMSGEKAWSYHAFNLSVHILAGLTLFGIVRRTLARTGWAKSGTEAQPAFSGWKLAGSPTDAVALISALIWTVHPLQTEAVTYIVQRTESLMGLFYLLTLYCFVRQVDRFEGRAGPPAFTEASADWRFLPPKPWRRRLGPPVGPGGPSGPALPRKLRLWNSAWPGLSIVFCLLGMATKEVMVTAPIAVLLYDRTFVAGTLAEAWRRRRGYYFGLAATWLLLAALVATTGWTRGGTAGFGAGATAWEYGLTQLAAVAHYLRLAVWPDRLVFDYGEALVRDPQAVVLPGLALAILLAGTVVALARRSGWGFIGVWFFLTLAPSSSIVPVATQTMAEHRMYLALASVAVAAAIGLYRLPGRWSVPAGLALACGLGIATAQRNTLYASPRRLWTETILSRPANDRAHTNLGCVLLKAGQSREAIVQFDTALALNPDDPVAHFDLGDALARSGRTLEAIGQFQVSLRIDPNRAEAHFDLGNALYRSERLPEAIGQFEDALRLNPDYAEAKNGLGVALAEIGRVPEAIESYRAALRIRPDFVEAHYNLGCAELEEGRIDEAIGQFEAVLGLKPNDAKVHNGLGNLLLQTGRLPRAISEYEAALRISENLVEARSNLGVALSRAGRAEAAIEQFQIALRLDPGMAEVHYNFGNALLQAGRTAEAVAEFKSALRLKPGYPKARRALARAEAALGANPQ